MPCRDFYDDNPRAYYGERAATLEAEVRKLQKQISFAESALCAALKAGQKAAHDVIRADFYDIIDFPEAGITRQELAEWETKHRALYEAPQPQQSAPVQEPVHKLIYPGGGKALFNRLWHLTCNAVATQSGMRVRTDVMPMREMKEFLDHLCVLVDSPPQPVPAPVQEPVNIEQIAAERYKIAPTHESMFYRWAVVAGDGSQQLYIGREVDCQNMARKFAGAFLDGAYLAASQPAPAQEPVPLLTDEEVSHIAVANAIEFHEFAHAIEAAAKEAKRAAAEAKKKLKEAVLAKLTAEEKAALGIK